MDRNLDLMKNKAKKEQICNNFTEIKKMFLKLLLNIKKY